MTNELGKRLFKSLTDRDSCPRSELKVLFVLYVAKEKYKLIVKILNSLDFMICVVHIFVYTVVSCFCYCEIMNVFFNLAGLSLSDVITCFHDPFHKILSRLSQDVGNS